MEYYALIMLHTKFEATPCKDYGSRIFSVKTHPLRQILDFVYHNFLPVAPMVVILVFLENSCGKLSMKVYFELIPHLTHGPLVYDTIVTNLLRQTKWECNPALPRWKGCIWQALFAKFSGKGYVWLTSHEIDV